nr:bHLH11 [Bupleurum chinense]
MADEVQAEAYAENCWMMNSCQSNFGSSVCSPMINNMNIFSWDTKVRASTDDEFEGSVIFQDIKKPFFEDFVDGALLSMNSTLELMDSSLSASSITTDWDQTLLDDSKRNECNYQGDLQGSLNSISYYHQDEDAADHFSQYKKNLNSEIFATNKADGNQGFPISSSLYGCTSSFVQTLFDTNSDNDSMFGNRTIIHPALTTQERLNEFPSSLHKPDSHHLDIPNNSPWHPSKDGLFTPPQFSSPKFDQDHKLKCSKLSVNSSNHERIRDMSVVVKNSSTETVFKRPRIETPSPLPTFKVRKEKLGDRVTALQQLVSPFGKTDTASVLHEAIEYIKHLHDQVTVLITPYMKRESPIHHEQTHTDGEGTNQELKTRGLCLVPISSTFPVASETTAEFWSPTFGAYIK